MRTRLIPAVIVSLALGSSNALAHAYLEQANPRVGSTVRSAPSQLTLTFSQNIEPSFSSADVRNSAGGRVDQGTSASGNIMFVNVGSLPPGTYKVHWHILSVDTHKTEGGFSFTIAK